MKSPPIYEHLSRNHANNQDMDTAQPLTNMMTVEDPQPQLALNQEEEQVKRLRGGGCCTDCLIYDLKNGPG